MLEKLEIIFEELQNLIPNSEKSTPVRYKKAIEEQDLSAAPEPPPRSIVEAKTSGNLPFLLIFIFELNLPSGKLFV